MDEYLLALVDKLIGLGVFETRAPLYIDIIISFLAMLPILSGISIFLAVKKHIKLHQTSQFLLFFITLITLALFAYIVHYDKGFELLLQQSNIADKTALFILITHIIISIITLILWIFTLIYALSDKKRRALPGIYSVSHAQAGRRVFKGIFLMTLSSISVYWMLFIA